jgi:hypothetical protein
LDAILSAQQFAKGSSPARMENFRNNPFDPRLRPHKIQYLSVIYGRTIYAVDIENDLRSTFYLDGDSIISVDIGTHAIYKG